MAVGMRYAQVPADEQSGMERGEVHEDSRQKLGKEEEVFLRGTVQGNLPIRQEMVTYTHRCMGSS